MPSHLSKSTIFWYEDCEHDRDFGLEYIIHARICEHQYVTQTKSTSEIQENIRSHVIEEFACIERILIRKANKKRAMKKLRSFILCASAFIGIYTEVKYRPDHTGYLEAEESFNSLRA
jgi:hypothetical protein